MSASHQQQLGHAAGASQYDSALAKRLDSLEQRMATSESTVAEQAALMLTPEMVERLEDEIARLDREREDATTQLEDQLYASIAGASVDVLGGELHLALHWECVAPDGAVARRWTTHASAGCASRSRTPAA